MKKQFYVAYGSNLNIGQMKYRCPGATLYGTGVIDNYELQFKGHPDSAFATIAPKTGSCVPVAVWEISAKNEQTLDRYEGYPSHYFKQNIPVNIGGKEIDAMVYIMNLKMKFGLPSPYYYKTVYEGYNDCNLNTDILDKAVAESAKQFYIAHRQKLVQHTLFDTESDEDYLSESDEYEENDIDDNESDIDENDPFYFSEGMQL